jgi:glycosyltransferase involved in cell wall biosynthesis
MTFEDTPLITIGVPVYQGENYLREALDALLAQTIQDFEIVISDNASTDATSEICQEYVSRDPRIRYHRQDVNTGAVRNYNLVFEMARGKYFKWAAHDDVCLPRFLEACLQGLESDHASVVAYPLHEIIDSDGQTVAPGGDAPDTTSTSPAKRMRAVLTDKPGAEPPWTVFGLIRRSALETTRRHGSYTGSDRTLMVELALRGPFVQIDEILFRNREHPERSIRMPEQKKLFHRREVWFAPEHAGKVVFPNWRRLQQLITAVTSAPLPIAERMRCARVLLAWVAAGNWKRLVRDVAVALVITVRPGLRPG